MMKKLVITTVLIAVVGSVSAQNNCDELARKYDSLKGDYDSLQLAYMELIKITLEIKNAESEALYYVKDWYSFYNRDYVYRAPKVRKHSNRKFIISLDEKRRDSYFWDAQVYYLTIDEDGYTMSELPSSFESILEGAVHQRYKTNETGDLGNEEGSIDSRALYGNQGGGGGSSLELAGWIWDFKPQPKDTSEKSGKIVFEIKIDDRGEIISIITLEKTVSPTVEAIYKAEVQKLTFSKTDNRSPAQQSVGRITFIIKSN